MFEQIQGRTVCLPLFFYMAIIQNKGWFLTSDQQIQPGPVFAAWCSLSVACYVSTVYLPQNEKYQ
jgi:hypothetical protein